MWTSIRTRNLFIQDSLSDELFLIRPILKRLLETIAAHVLGQFPTRRFERGCYGGRGRKNVTYVEEGQQCKHTSYHKR